MICIKTGFFGRLPNGDFIYGDAFAMTHGEWPDEPIPIPTCHLLLRVTSIWLKSPIRIHIELNAYYRWFDEHRADVVSRRPDFSAVWNPPSTLIASADQWSWLGYEGVKP